MKAAVLAIDGGNSKTDVALVDGDGHNLAHVRGPGSSPHALGLDGCAALLDDLVAKAAAQAAVVGGPRGIAALASVYLAGADIPEETAMLREAIAACGWADDLVVDNDTVALLRAGTDERDAVAVVCGAGINCVGVRSDGRQTRFPSLGRISGDWGGGFELGDQALFSAARADDGRGPSTVLTQRIVDHFGRRSLPEVIEDLHFGRLARPRLGELAPLVLRAASGDRDPVAVQIVTRQAEEIVLYAATALGRLDLLDQRAVVVLGGGVLTSRDPLLHRLIDSRLADRAPRARTTITEAAPVVGAALLGLDRLGATVDAERRLRTSLRVDGR
jgi:N-acetylglucosamine kinase-like BadF-type ATPase